jgi:hypothetical protein
MYRPVEKLLWMHSQDASIAKFNRLDINFFLFTSRQYLNFAFFAGNCAVTGNLFNRRVRKENEIL